MDPENLDRLRRIGEVIHGALNNPNDYQSIADLCREGYALKLFLHTAKRHRLLVGRERATCHAEGLAKNALVKKAAFLEVFVDRRLVLYEGGVLCKQFVPRDLPETGNCSVQKPSGLPDPVDDEFTAVEWPSDAPHLDRFPYMVLLVRSEQPRVYTILPMDPLLLSREDAAFETARIFSVYSEVDVCLVLGPERCIYIYKDGKYKRSRLRPTGGAVAHRSVTGPHLYSLHLEPLTATLEDRPTAFRWEDEFDSDLANFTGRDYFLGEAIISLDVDIVSNVKAKIQRMVDDFLPIYGREWDGDRAALTQSTVNWLRALGLPDTVRVIGKDDLTDMCSHPLLPSQYFRSALYTTLDAALDVMELELNRAGLLELFNDLLDPVYQVSHIGYFRLLEQCTRLAGQPDNQAFWNRVQGLVYPAAGCSPVTLLRLEAWRQVRPLYRDLLPQSGTERGACEGVQKVLDGLPFLMNVNENGPMWMWQTCEGICVTPAVVVRVDADGELHCEDGPALIDPDGTKIFAVHGEIQ